MIIDRKAYKRMLKWKSQSQGKSALLLNGARRVGKSFLINCFGKNEYKSMISIDFSNPPKDVIGIFENDSHDIPAFLTKLSLYYRVKLHPRESLIVFDEVQLYPQARQLIKHLVADGKYDYIESGSLLSLKENVKNILIPSEEEVLEIHPLDFEEYLNAMGDDVTIPYVKECFDNRRPLGQALHRRIITDFRTYLLVGGMPQAVVEYAATRDFETTDHVKRSILTLYRSDIAKYSGLYKGKVTAIFDDMPNQLSKADKRRCDPPAHLYGYVSVSTSWRRAVVKELVSPCFACKSAASPLLRYELLYELSSNRFSIGTSSTLDNPYNSISVTVRCLSSILDIEPRQI